MLDDPQVVDQLPQRHVAQPGNIVLIDQVDELTRLLAADRGIGDHQRLIRGGGRHLHACEHAGREQAVGIGQLRTPADRAAGAVDRVVDEIHPRRVRELGLVEQLQANRGAAEAGYLVPAGRQSLVAQQRRLVEGEFEPDRIDGDDGGEHGGVAAGAAGDQVALGHAPIADAAGDRRLELGVLEIKLRLAHHRLVGRHRGLGIAESLHPLLVDLLADGAFAHELLGAREV